MSDSHSYRFCPRCGALMTEQVCMNCGYTAHEEGNADEKRSVGTDQNDREFCGGDAQREDSRRRNRGQEETGNSAYGSGRKQEYGGYGYASSNRGDYGFEPYRGEARPEREPEREGRGDGHRFLIGILCGVILVLLCVILVLSVLLYRLAGGEGQNGPAYQPQAGGYAPDDRMETWPYEEWFEGFWDEDPGEDIVDPFGDTQEGGIYGDLPGEDAALQEDEEETEYVPSEEDEYYLRITDSIREDLTYSVEWTEFSYEDAETGATSSGRYPVLVGGNIPNLDALNELIQTNATYYNEMYSYYRMFSDGSTFSASSYAYVTYMDEEIISIVLKEEVTYEGSTSVDLYSMNIDLISGELMENSSMIEYSQELAAEFRSQSEYQNGTIDFLDTLTDEELVAYLSDASQGIAFYTPVGLEIGFNYTSLYSSGWVTATIRDYEQYRKKI